MRSETLVSTVKAARLLGVCVATVRRRCKEGKLKTLQMGPRGWHRIVLTEEMRRTAERE